MKYSFSTVVAASLLVTVAASGSSVAKTNSKSAPASPTRPDFEGVWSIVTLTPFQRPKDLEGQPYLTAEQARDYVARRAKEVDFDRRGATPEADLQLPSV